MSPPPLADAPAAAILVDAASAAASVLPPEVRVAPRVPPLGAACTDFTWCPVALTLHPVHVSYAATLQAGYVRAIDGGEPNPVLNATMNEADIHWRLLRETGRGLPLDAETAERWSQAATDAFLLAFNFMLDDTVSRAPDLGVARTVADAVVTPSLEVGADDEGRVRVGHRTGGRAVRQVREAREDLGQPAGDGNGLGARGRRRNRPRFSFGFGWELRPLDADTDEPFVTWGAWVDAADVLLSNLRAEVSFVDGSWRASARRRLFAKVYATASLRSAEGRPDPGRWAVGLQTEVPGAPRWTARLERQARIPDGEVTWQLTLRAEIGARVPAALVPPLAPWPAIEPYGPNPVGWVVPASPATATATPPTSGSSAPW